METVAVTINIEVKHNGRTVPMAPTRHRINPHNIPIDRKVILTSNGWHGEEHFQMAKATLVAYIDEALYHQQNNAQAHVLVERLLKQYGIKIEDAENVHPRWVHEAARDAIQSAIRSQSQDPFA